MPRRRKVYDACAYCGVHGKLTRDHVIPKSLFPADEPLSGDIPKVYACEKCNTLQKSAYDTNLRDLLYFDIDSSQSPQAQRLQSKVASAISGNHSKMAKAMRENSYPVTQNIEPGVTAINRKYITRSK